MRPSWGAKQVRSSFEQWALAFQTTSNKEGVYPRREHLPCLTHGPQTLYSRKPRVSGLTSSVGGSFDSHSDTDSGPSSRRLPRLFVTGALRVAKDQNGKKRTNTAHACEAAEFFPLTHALVEGSRTIFSPEACYLRSSTRTTPLTQKHDQLKKKRRSIR